MVRTRDLSDFPLGMSHLECFSVPCRHFIFETKFKVINVTAMESFKKGPPPLKGKRDIFSF